MKFVYLNNMFPPPDVPCSKMHAFRPKSYPPNPPPDLSPIATTTTTTTTTTNNNSNEDSVEESQANNNKPFHTSRLPNHNKAQIIIFQVKHAGFALLSLFFTLLQKAFIKGSPQETGLISRPHKKTDGFSSDDPGIIVYSSDDDEESDFCPEPFQHNKHGSRGVLRKFDPTCIRNSVIAFLRPLAKCNGDHHQLQGRCFGGHYSPDECYSCSKYHINSNQNRIMTQLLVGMSVTRLAILSRLILLSIEILANNLLDRVRHENDGFRFSPENGYGTKRLDPLVNATLGGFANWDGQYFLHIAVRGYTTENMLAFFPLFPMLISCASHLSYIIIGRYISLSSLVLIFSWIMNTTLFVKSANLLYDLVQVAGIAVDTAPVILLFCFNPASIFFSSVYTESLFTYITLKVLLSLYHGNPYIALTWTSLSTLCRSNGILNFGFVAAYFLQKAWLAFCRERRNPWKVLIPNGFICVFFLAPFLIFQNYAIIKFCHGQSHELPPYCRYERLPYSYIQEKYWNVGPFMYFKWKQIPNFMLAAPVLYVQFTKNWMILIPLVIRLLTLPRTVNLCGLYIAAHGVFLAVFCCIFMHVQVSTRLILSAFPYIYLYIAQSCGNEIAAFRQRIIMWPVEVTCTQLWCIFYFFIGTIAFSLGLPWT